MRLSEWLDSSGISQSELARRLGTSQGYVNDMLWRGRWPSRAMMKRIMEATDGAVTPNDFIALERRVVTRELID